jgi:hypothetical protein
VKIRPPQRISPLILEPDPSSSSSSSKICSHPPPDTRRHEMMLYALYLVILFLHATKATNCAHPVYCTSYPPCSALCLGDIDNNKALGRNTGSWNDACGDDANIRTIYEEAWVNCVAKNCTTTKQDVFDQFAADCEKNLHPIPVSLVPSGYTLKGKAVSDQYISCG